MARRWYEGAEERGGNKKGGASLEDPLPPLLRKMGTHFLAMGERLRLFFFFCTKERALKGKEEEEEKEEALGSESGIHGGCLCPLLFSFISSSFYTTLVHGILSRWRLA